MDSTTISHFIRFGIVGFSGVFVDFGITWLAKEQLKWNKYVANSLGFVTAVCWNYWFNRIWTFHSTDPNMGFQFAKFFALSLIGLGLNNGLIYLFTERFKVTFYPAKLAATGVVVLWNFWANNRFTFR